MTAAIWLAVGATSAAFGSIWQMVLSARAGIDSMDSFLGAQNEIWREERARVRSEVPRWKVRRRRQELKLAIQNARSTLTPDEMKLDKAYDSQGTGWSFVVVGTVIAAIVSWVAATSE